MCVSCVFSTSVIVRFALIFSTCVHSALPSLCLCAPCHLHTLCQVFQNIPGVCISGFSIFALPIDLAEALPFKLFALLLLFCAPTCFLDKGLIFVN